MKRSRVRRIVAGLLAGGVLLAVGGCADMDLLHVLKARVTGEVLAVHVAPDGTIGGTNQGFDPSRPVGSLSNAAWVARDAGATEIRVAEGQYEIASEDSDDPDGPLKLESEVTVRGGYSADFEDRDVGRYESRIVVRGWIEEVVGCSFDPEYGEPSQPVRLDGLLFDVVLTDAVPERVDWSRGLIELNGASVVTVENCTIQVTTGGEFNRRVTAFAVGGRSDWDNSSPAQGVTVRNNTILAVAENGEDTTGLSVELLEPGGEHEVWGNRIMVQGANATGLYLDGAADLLVANNVISVRAEDYTSGEERAYGIRARNDMMSGAIVHNTIAFDAPDYEYGIHAEYSSGSSFEADIVSNIFAGRDSDDSTAIGVSSAAAEPDPFYDHNLCFGTGTATDAGVETGGNNTHNTADLFVDVFGEDRDWDLSDGDEVDYQLTGEDASTWAIDQGSPDDPWADVDTDIRGVSRPQGGAFDRGAYEMEE